MTRRSPEPDILTPREHEVLALLREGLTNPQIAERLSITLDGAKYHVSEILSKLGVSGREEAARWDPSERPWWASSAVPLVWSWRRGNVSWLATGVAGITGVLVVAGIVLLTWGLLRTDGEAAESSGGSSLQIEPTATAGRSSEETLLLTDKRSRLSICVDRADEPGVDVAVDVADVDAVETALVTGFSSLDRIPDEYQEHVIISGCPTTSEVLGTRVVFPGLSAPRVDDGPSEHSLWVYFVDADTYDASFDKPIYKGTSAEIACEDDFCLEVTHALFVSTAASEEELRRAVLEVLRLVRRVLPPEPTFDWSACDRGWQPHTDYTCDDYWKFDGETS